MTNSHRPEHRYNDGRLYRLARGNSSPRADAVEVLSATHAVVNVREVTGSQLVQIIEREMRIRFYRQRSVKAYCSALRSFLTWLAAPPAEANRELVRQYLEYLVDGGASASWVAVNLA